MNIDIITALIGGTTALVVSLITTYIANRYSRTQFLKEQERRFTEKLYEQRLDKYPVLFDITIKLSGRALFKTPIFPEMFNNIAHEIDKALAKSLTILSEDSYSALLDLRSNLRVYSEEDENKKLVLGEIYNCKNRLQKSLRNDLGLLFSEEIASKDQK